MKVNGIFYTGFLGSPIILFALLQWMLFGDTLGCQVVKDATDWEKKFKHASNLYNSIAKQMPLFFSQQDSTMEKLKKALSGAKVMWEEDYKNALEKLNADLGLPPLTKDDSLNSSDTPLSEQPITKRVLNILCKLVDNLQEHANEINELAKVLAEFIMDGKTMQPSNPSSIRFLPEIIPYITRLYQWHRALTKFIISFDPQSSIKLTLDIPIILTDPYYVGGWEEDGPNLQDTYVDFFLEKMPLKYNCNDCIDLINRLCEEFKETLGNGRFHWNKLATENFKLLQQTLFEYSMMSSTDPLVDLIELIKEILYAMHFDTEFVTTSSQGQQMMMLFQSNLSTAGLYIKENCFDLFSEMFASYFQNSKQIQMIEVNAILTMKRALLTIEPIFRAIPPEMTVNAIEGGHLFHFLDLFPTGSISSIFVGNNHYWKALIEYAEKFGLYRIAKSQEYWIYKDYDAKGLAQDVYDILFRLKNPELQQKLSHITGVTDWYVFHNRGWRAKKERDPIIFFVEHLLEALDFINCENCGELKKKLYRRLHPFFGELMDLFTKDGKLDSISKHIPKELFEDALELIETQENNPTSNPSAKPTLHQWFTTANIASLIPFMPESCISDRKFFIERIIMKSTSNETRWRLFYQLIRRSDQEFFTSIGDFKDDPRMIALLELAFIDYLQNTGKSNYMDYGTHWRRDLPLSSCKTFSPSRWHSLIMAISSFINNDEERVRLGVGKKLYEGYQNQVKAVEDLLMSMLNDPSRIRTDASSEKKSLNIVHLAQFIQYVPYYDCLHLETYEFYYPYCCFVIQGALSRAPNYEFLDSPAFTENMSSICVPGHFRCIISSALISFLNVLPYLLLPHQHIMLGKLSLLKNMIWSGNFGYSWHSKTYTVFAEVTRIIGMEIGSAVGAVFDWFGKQKISQQEYSNESFAILEEILDKAITIAALKWSMMKFLEDYSTAISEEVMEGTWEAFQILFALMDRHGVPRCNDNLIMKSKTIFMKIYNNPLYNNLKE